MQLNKYLAYAGISSRRKSVELIKQGIVTVNNAVVFEPAYVVRSKDAIRVNKKLVVPQEFIYILLNKPKGYITTTADELHRTTVMDLLRSKGFKKNVNPVGRLDRDSTGLLLLTNDGVLAQKLAHPRYETVKIYVVTLDTPFDFQHHEELIRGVRLIDGIATVDTVVALNQNKTRLKVVLHSGKNRIIRRLFEHLGYTVTKLDRVSYARLTKKNLPVGNWRHLTQKEVDILKNS